MMEKKKKDQVEEGTKESGQVKSRRKTSMLMVVRPLRGRRASFWIRCWTLM